MKQLGFHWTDFHEIRYSRSFRKSVKKSQVSLKSKKRLLYMKTNIPTSRWILLRIRNILNESCRENHDTHILCSVTFIRKPCLLWDAWKTFSRDRPQVTIQRMRFACWITKTRIQTHKHNTSTYCFSDATVLTRTRLNVTLYVHCLSRFLLWYITLTTSDEQIMAHVKEW